MAEERNTESFALGVIVAVIIFLLLRREFARREVSAGASATDQAVSTASTTKGGCGCSGGKGSSKSAVIAIGGQSYGTQPFTGSNAPKNPSQLVYAPIA